MRYLLVLVGTVAACDGPASIVMDGSIDMALVDADTDAQLDAVPSGVVTVTVRSKSEHVVLPDAPVLFMAPDGTTTRVVTDSLGQASAEVVAGTSVTAVFTDYPSIATIVDVKPGDHLVFGAGRLVRGGTLNVTFEPFAGADSYRLHSPCALHGNVTPGTSIIELSFCVEPLDDATLLVEALNSLGEPLATVALAHADLTSGSLTLPATWTPLETLAIDLANPPMFIDPYVQYAAVPERYGDSGVAHSPAFDLAFQVPSTPMTSFVSVNLSNGTLEGSETLVDPLAPGTSSYQLDLETIRQPRIQSVSFTPAERRFEVVAIGQRLDFATYTVLFGPNGSFTWEIFAPTLEPQTFPVLPADLDPITQGYEYRAASVSMYEVADHEGWDAVRAEVFTLEQMVYGSRSPTSRTYRQVRTHYVD